MSGKDDASAIFNMSEADRARWDLMWAKADAADDVDAAQRGWGALVEQWRARAELAEKELQMVREMCLDAMRIPKQSQKRPVGWNLAHEILDALEKKVEKP